MRSTRTVLLVDDDENDVLLMRHAFEAGDFQFPVKEVTGGEQAISYLKGEGIYSNRSEFPVPAMVILDLKMPRLNGFDVLTWIQTQPELSNLRVVITTTSSEAQDVARAHQLGATCYIVKPMSLADLGAMVRTLREFVRMDHFPPLNGLVTR
jgi:CheY-like chemotaxis protein